ncbi:hypothetical protein BsWGS_24065 [Bradybaena similaris]
MFVNLGRYTVLVIAVYVLLMFTNIWKHFRECQPNYAYQQRILSKSYGRKETVNNTTTNTPYHQAQTTETSTPPASTSIRTNFNVLYNDTSLVNNGSLYVTSNCIFCGRMGNQMFKYASILGLVRAQGRRMFIVPNTELEKTFKISYVANHSIQQWPKVREHHFFESKLWSLPLQNVTVCCNLQSFWYFADVIDEDRQEFTFLDSVANDAAKILPDVQLKQNSSMIIGLHVRRSDFLSEKYLGKGYEVADKSYFMKAFSLMKSTFPGRNITFLVASDDLPWCLENLLQHDVVIMPPASYFVHLAVLSNCDHMIITGGTFGWWSGWLANGYVIYFTGYMAQRKWTKNRQYYPRLWIAMGN